MTDSFVAFFIIHLRHNAFKIHACFFFQDVSHARDKGIVILCAFQSAVSHAFAEIKQFCVKSKAFICPAVNVFYGIMVSELVCSGMGVVVFISQLPKVFLYPVAPVERISPCWEKESPVRVLLPYGCIIYFQKFKHGVMQHYIMLGMPFRIADVYNPMA